MKRFILFILIFLFSCSSEDLLGLDSQAPDFTLKTHTGTEITLSETLKKSRVLLIFYPGDNTPVCKKQLCEIRDNYEMLQEKGYEIYGINDGDAESHKSFVEKNKYQFPLLIDSTKEIIKRYNCSGKLGIKRTVYVIDRDGTIIFAQRGKPSSLAIVESLSK